VTGTEFKKARHTLGLSCAMCARMLKLGKGGGRTIRRWESDSFPVPGPAQVVMDWLISGNPPHVEGRDEDIG